MIGLKINNLTKKYYDTVAIDSISFNIESGSIVGFLGPNGAGKTTTMRILSGYMPPTKGTALIENVDVVNNPFEVKKLSGYLPEDNPLYPDMTPLEILEFSARIRNIKKSYFKKRIKEVIEICGLDEVLIKPVHALSKGYRQRVGIAQAILHDPPVLLLDEPTSGLDPNQIQEIRKLIKNLQGQKSIIISTHIMQEVQAICQRVIIVNKGKIVADATHDELTSSSQYIVELDGPENDVLTELTKIPSVNNVKKDEQVFKLDCSEKYDPRRDIFKLAVEKNWTILSIQKTRQSLEEVFRNLTLEEN